MTFHLRVFFLNDLPDLPKRNVKSGRLTIFNSDDISKRHDL